MPETPPVDASDRLPVPIAVLLPPTTVRHRPPPSSCQEGLTPATARLLVATYTCPGDLVVAINGSGCLGAVSAGMGRRAVVLATDTAPNGEPDAVSEAGGGPVCTITAPVEAVPALLRGVSGRTQLLVTRLPLPARRLDLRWAGRWLAACRDALASDGYLLVTVDAGSGNRYVDHATTVIVAARAAGLVYHQHLVTVTQPLSESGAADDAALPLAPAARHTRLHTDLFVFAAGGDRRA